jgi:hypothetical protein
MKPPQSFCAKGVVWKYSGAGGWHFVHVDEDDSELIKQISIDKTIGMGSVKVNARIDETAWETTLFPTKDGRYLIAIKASVRKAEGIVEGDKVRIEFELI